MEEHEQQEKKPIENWQGEERRHGPGADYKGDERRKSAAPREDMPTGDLTGGDVGMSDEDNERQR